jgi:hypothetical protein
MDTADLATTLRETYLACTLGGSLQQEWIVRGGAWAVVSHAEAERYRALLASLSAAVGRRLGFR